MMRATETCDGRMRPHRKTGPQARQNSQANDSACEPNGFTLVEMVVTLAVAAIIAAMTIPNLVTWYRSYKATERQANAELIYTTAQNNIAQLKANGQLDDSQTETTALDGQRATLVAAANKAQVKAAVHTGGTAGAADDAGITLLSSDDSSAADALDLLVPNIDDTLSRVGYSSMSYATGAHYRIEYNATLGYVYRVFFSENEISQSDYEQAAEAAANHDDGKLADLGISYYGGTKPKTFSPSERQPARWVGYFEFADDSTGRTNVTGGYYYQISADNTVSDGAVDHLHNDNEIDEGAVHSSDGTAYGVLVSKSETTKPGFVAPTDVNLNTFDVALTNGFGAEGVDPNCVFYKMDAPNSSSDAGQQATYTIEYQVYWGNGANDHWQFSDSHQATVGSTVSVTNDNLDNDSYGQAREQIKRGYRIDASRSKLSGTVTADGALKLTVALIPSNVSGYDRAIDSVPEPTMKNGVGTWYPWSASSNTDLGKLAFYVNQNFASCISKGESAPTGSAVTSYQVRTDDQLQHIGSPYGSTYDAPDTSYLSKDFYQTHDITIDQLWYPIGQEQSDATVDGRQIGTGARFSGEFYGGYSGYADEDHSQLAKPASDSQAFTITLAKRTDETDESRKGELFSINPAYTTSDGYRSYGIFGFVTGGIAYARVSVGTEADGLDLGESFDTPHYGTLVGDLDGNVSHSSVNIAKSSSLRIRQGDGSQGERKTDDAIVGGLCGRMRREATITDSSLTLADNETTERDPRFEIIASPRENIAQSVSVGGLVGRANCNSEKFLSNCSVSLGDDATIDAQGNTSGNKQVSAGGFVGYVQAGERASIEDCRMTVARTLRVETPDSNEAWDNPTAMGGFAGYVEGGANIVRASLADGDSTNGNVIVTAKARGTQAAAGGMFGYLHNASFDTAGINIDSDLTVTATSTNTNGLAGGIVGLADNDRSSTLKGASLTVNGNASVESTNSYTAYAGGIAGRLTRIALDGASASVNGTGKVLSVTARGAHTTSEAGGMVGEMENAAGMSSPTLTARTLSVTSTEDDGEAIAGGLVGRATKGDQQASGISGAAVTVNGDANIESTGTTTYALSGLLAGQLDSVAVDGAASTVSGNLTSKATDTRGASARAAGLIAQFENGSALNGATLTVTGDLEAATSSNNGTSLASGYVAYAASDPSPLQVTGASLSVGGNVNVHGSASNAREDSFSGALAGQLRSVGFTSPAVTVGASLTSTTESTGGGTRAGGLVGEIVRNGSVDAASLSGVSPTLHDTTVSAKSTNSDAHAGGFVAKDDSTDISGSALGPQGSLSVTAEGTNEVHAGGFAAQADSSTISDTSFAPTGDLSVEGKTTGYGGAYAGGLVGQANSSSSITGASMAPASGTDVSATSNSDVYAGGAIGQADSSTLSDSPLQPTGSLSVTGTSVGSGGAYVGGLVGQAKSLTASNDALRPNADLTINGTGKSNVSSGGLMGGVEESGIAYLSLLKSAGAGGTSVSVSGDTSAGSGSAYVAGGFGSVSDTDVSNSYVVTRNAPLVLSNKGNNGATGGFAGSVTANDGSHAITTSFVNAGINSSSPSVAGFVDSTSASNNNLRFTSDFVIASISGSTPGNQTAAFIRNVSYVNGIRGDYAVVTDASGATPYKFAINGDLNAENGTERCFIYRVGMTELVDEKFDQKDGAHPASYAYLTQTNNAEVTVPWNKSLKTSSVLDFLGTVSKPGITARYGFVTKDSTVTMLRDGDNPFPTATQDEGGAYVNYGNWPAAPATATTDSSDASEANSADANATTGGASSSTNGSSTAQNGSPAASDDASSNGTPANAPAQGAGSSAANAMESGSTIAGDGGNGGDDQ